MISENQDQYSTRSRSKIKITNNDLDHGKDQDQWNNLDLLRAKINDLIQLCPRLTCQISSTLEKSVVTLQEVYLSSPPKASVVHSQRDLGVVTKTCQPVPAPLQLRPVTCPFRVTEQKHTGAGAGGTNKNKWPKRTKRPSPLLFLPSSDTLPLSALLQS